MCSRARAASPAADEGAEQDTGPSSAPNAPLRLGAGRCRICPVPTAARPPCRPPPHTPLCRSRKDAATRARQRGVHQPARTFAAARRRWTRGWRRPELAHALYRFSGRARPLCLSAARRWVSRTLLLSAPPSGHSSFLLPRQFTPPFCSPVTVFRPLFLSALLPLPLCHSLPSRCSVPPHRCLYLSSSPFLCVPLASPLILFFPPVFPPLSSSSFCSPASPLVSYRDPEHATAPWRRPPPPSRHRLHRSLSRPARGPPAHGAVGEGSGDTAPCARMCA